jgi:beta-N-acetylhexosaminidase
MRAALVALGVAVLVGASGAAARRDASSPTLEQLVGQRLVVAMRGTTPSADLLARAQQGRVGGVILFGGNVRTAPQVRALVGRLQAAASAGGRPPLLIAVDQEGGDIRRFRWAPPARSAVALAEAPARLRAAGRATAAALRGLGVNVDLAPVADVPAVRGSFIARQGRAFSTDPAETGRLAADFAAGLADGRVAATGKHFPGLGRAAVTTDTNAVTIGASWAALTAHDLVPYRTLIEARIPLVMLSNAVYPALDAKPGAWSPAVESLLRNTLGFTGVTITDALDAAAVTHHRSVPSSAVLAAQSGADLLLVAGSEALGDAVYERLLATARAGRLPRAGLERSYARILALKRSLT